MSRAERRGNPGRGSRGRSGDITWRLSLQRSKAAQHKQIRGIGALAGLPESTRRSLNEAGPRAGLG